MRWVRSPSFWKAVVASGLPSALVALVIWKFDDTSHAVYIGIAIVVAVSGVTYYFLSRTETRRREGELQRQIETLRREKATAETTGRIFDTSVRHLRENVFAAGQTQHVVSLAHTMIHGALGVVQLLAARHTEGEVRVTFMEPKDERMLRITHHFYADRGDPESTGYEFELADRQCEHVTTAGHAWDQWRGGGPSHVLIPDILKHLSETEGRPKDRRFSVIYGNQTETIRSILCIVVFCKPKEGAAVFHGVLSLDSDEVGAFTEANWPHIRNSVKPILRLLSLACFLKRGISPTPS